MVFAVMAFFAFLKLPMNHDEPIHEVEYRSGTEIPLSYVMLCGGLSVTS
jgi:hypothetical protein